MANRIDPLTGNAPIVTPSGAPTLEFQRIWRQIVGATDVQAVFDQLDGAQGSIVYRGTTTWLPLPPGADGYVLTTHGGGKDPTWEPAASGVAGADPTAEIGPAAVNGTALTFLRSDAAQKLADTAVTPATYGDSTHYATFTVDQQGRLTAAAQVAISGSGYAPGTVPTVVQFGHSVGGGNSVTLGVAPTNGNLLVALATNPTSDTVGAGWTKVVDNPNGLDYGLAFTKVAGAGESTTQTPLSGVGTKGCISMWELHGQNASPFAYGQSQTEQSSSQAVALLTPNLFNCIGLCHIGVDSVNISSAYNEGTRDVLDNSNADRKMVAGHTDLSKGPVLGIIANYASSTNSKEIVVLITS